MNIKVIKTTSVPIKSGHTGFAPALTLICSFALLAACYCASYAASSPAFRVNTARSGAIVEEAYPKLTSLWNLQIQGEFVSSPVVYKDVVYCGGRDGSVYAWNAANGEEIWQYSCDGWVDASPYVTSDSVYIPSRDGYFYAFNRLTGDIRWKTYTGSDDCSSPALYNGKLYIISGNPEKKLYELDANSGALSVAATLGQFGFSSPAVKGSLLFFGTNDGSFHCFDLEAKSMKWSVATAGGINFSTFAAADDYVYAVSGGDERRLFCLNSQTGSTVWKSQEFDNDPAAVSSVSLGDDAVYVASSYRVITDTTTSAMSTVLRLLCFKYSSVKSQDTLYDWISVIGKPHPSGIVSSPSLANGAIYIGSGDGYLYCIDSSDGRYIDAGGLPTTTATGYFLCDAQNPSYGIVATPVISNGKIFVGTFDGYFWAFDAYKKLYVSVPDNNDTVTNSVMIEGAAAGFSLAGYTLEYGKGSAPSSWQTIVSSGSEPLSEELAAWNTSSLNDGTYSVRITPMDGSPSKAVNVFSIDNAPRAPSELLAKDTPFDGGGSLTLTWRVSPDDGGGNNDVTGYKIYKSTSSSGFAYLTATAKGVTTYIDAACPTQTTFYYVVTAVDAVSESADSAPAWAFSLLDGVEITPEAGGTVTITDSNGLVTEAVFEPGTVSEKVWVGILTPSDYSNTGVPDSARGTTIVREFGITPAGTVFLKPVTIKIPYRAQDIINMKKSFLRIYWWDTSKSKWRIVNTSDPDSEDGRVWARLPHFSIYRIMEYWPGREPLLTAESVYSYPNPAKGSKLYFKYYLGDKADVTIDVYNVAAELIAHIDKPNNPAGIASEAEWDISNIASGVYIYRIEAKAASGTKSLKKKLAIIH